MNPEQWLSLKWNGGSTMSDRWLNQSKIIHEIFPHLSFLCKDLFIGMSQAAFYKGSSFYHLFFFFIRAVRG